MKFTSLFTILVLFLLFTQRCQQNETNTNTEGTTNNTTNTQTNGTTNGETNNTTNGQTNSTTNGQTNGTTNGETNGQTNGTTNGETNGQTNGETVQPLQCTKPCEQLSYQSCTLCSQICKNVTTGEITSYKLTTCQIKQCKLWKSQPRSQAEQTNTQTICAEWQTKLLSEQQCGPSCCDQTFQVFTYENYEKCIQTNNQHSSSQTKVTVIIGVVLSSVLVFIIILVLVICCRDKITLCCKNFFYSIQTFFTRDQLKKPRDPSTDQSQHNQHDHTKNGNLKWETVQVKKQLTQLPTSKYIIESQYQINPEIYCSICLDTGLNTETHCQHHFHLTCLRKKMAKKLVCPQCQGKDFNPLKVTCDICMQKQTKFKIDKAYADYQLPDFFINNKIYCDSCLKKNIQSGHIKPKSKVMS